jgi:hypothetical protein
MSDEAKKQMLNGKNDGLLININAYKHGWEMMTSSFAIGKPKKNKIFIMP